MDYLSNTVDVLRSGANNINNNNNKYDT